MYSTVEEAVRAHPEVAEGIGRYREAIAAHRAQEEVRPSADRLRPACAALGMRADERS